MRIDLHTHTTASDGQYTPEELVNMAADSGVECLAVTDHDTVGAIAQARVFARKRGIRFIPGIEISSSSECGDIHILGYGIDENSPVLAELCRQLKQSRDDRKYRILEYLREKNVNLLLEDVEKYTGGQITARPHFARAMIEKGYVSDVEEAFSRYLATDEYKTRVERKKPQAEETIKAIHSAGGKAVLAHPGLIRADSDTFELNIRNLVMHGLDGIECYYTDHNAAQVLYFKGIALKYGLIVTAGSDFHGESIRENYLLGMNVDIDLTYLDRDPDIYRSDQ